jgi:hypothetical protein
MHKTMTLSALALGALSLWVANDVRCRGVGELEGFEGVARGERQERPAEPGHAGQPDGAADCDDPCSAWVVVASESPLADGASLPSLLYAGQTPGFVWWLQESLCPRESVFPGLPRRRAVPRSLLTLKQAWRIHDELLAQREDAPARPRSHVNAWIELNVHEGPVYVLRSATVDTRISARTGRILNTRKGGSLLLLGCPRFAPRYEVLALNPVDPFGTQPSTTLDSVLIMEQWRGRDPMTGTPRKLLTVQWQTSSHGERFPSSRAESCYLAADRRPLFCGHVALQPGHEDPHVVGFISPEEWRIHLAGSCELWSEGKRPKRRGSRIRFGRTLNEAWGRAARAGWLKWAICSRI